MMRRPLIVVAATLSTACVVGPKYAPEPAIAPAQRVGAERLSDSSRIFFDSLAAARRRDSAVVFRRPVLRQIANRDSVEAVAWLDIFRDSSLVRLVDVAIRQNRNLQLAQARIAESRAAVGVAKAPLVPSVSLNASQSTNQVATAGFPPSAFRATRATADLAWELDFWGRLRSGVTAASADLGAQEAATRATVLTLVSDIATSYLQLLELDQERSIAERTLTSRKATLEIARARYTQGLTSELDVRQFEAQVAAPAVTLAQAERAISTTEHNIDVLVGERPAPIARGRSLVDAVRALEIPDSISVALLARRPDVQQAERGYAAATARVGVADAARLPTISIAGSLGGQAGVANDVFGDNGRVYQLLAGISFPLFDNGRLSNLSAAARARAEQAKASYEQAALNALREAGDALSGVRAARDQAIAQATQANALRLALDLAESRYQAGLSSYLDLLDAQRSLFSAELALSQAQLNELTAAVQLYKALGGTWR
jgi:multidrug efflux system outer membrane protein